MITSNHDCTKEAKTCSLCRKTKPIADFCKNRANRDGLSYQCKVCHNQTHRQWRAKNVDAVRAKNQRWKQEHRDRSRELTRISHARYPERERARAAVRRAVRKGILVKPSACQWCNTDTPKANLHGHHKDYSAPLDVVWLCVSCHSTEHSAAALLAKEAE